MNDRSPKAPNGRRFRAVIFDLEGTLVDLRDYIGWSEEMATRGIAVDPEALAHWYTEKLREYDRITGQSATEGAFWKDVLESASAMSVSIDQAKEFLAAIRARGANVHLYSDTRRCLEQLASEGRDLAVISNTHRSETGVWELLDRAGISAYFAHVLSSSTEGVAKPNPEIFRRATRRLGIEPEDACYIGDLPITDAKGAESAGLVGIWLHRGGTGFGEDPPELTSLSELPKWIQNREGDGAPSRNRTGYIPREGSSRHRRAKPGSGEADGASTRRAGDE